MFFDSFLAYFKHYRKTRRMMYTRYFFLTKLNELYSSMREMCTSTFHSYTYQRSTHLLGEFVHTILDEPLRVE